MLQEHLKRARGGGSQDLKTENLITPVLHYLTYFDLNVVNHQMSLAAIQKQNTHNPTLRYLRLVHSKDKLLLPVSALSTHGSQLH